MTLNTLNDVQFKYNVQGVRCLVYILNGNDTGLRGQEELIGEGTGAGERQGEERDRVRKGDRGGKEERRKGGKETGEEGDRVRKETG